MRKPSRVIVYGGDHSPWVQAVLLGLHLKGVKHSMISAAPPDLFAYSGVLMPAARIDGGPWLYQSYDILHALGFDEASPDDIRAAFRALNGAAHRADSAWAFWHSWSLMRDGAPRRSWQLLNHIKRAFSVFYFFRALRRLIARGVRPLTPDAQFGYWLAQLEASTGPFMDGEDPNTRDLLLFGVVQCHASIPVPMLATLKQAPELQPLRDWIGAMQTRFGDYPHLYSGVHFAPDLPAPPQSGALDRACFWLGSAATLCLYPFSVRRADRLFQHVRALKLVR